MSDNIEVIEFVRPDECIKKLFITNLKESNCGEPSVQEQLWQHFCTEGLLYEVYVMATEEACNKDKNSRDVAIPAGEEVFAFVTFYSSGDAMQAKQRFAGRLVINGKLASIKFSRPRSAIGPPAPLYISKCYELANHFLGFNGWSAKILKLEPEVQEVESSPLATISVCCVVQIMLNIDKLHAEGAAIAKQEFTKSDYSSKGVAMCRARKQAYQLAMQNAFRRLVLVRLPGDGRVHVEVNTTLEEQLMYDEELDKKSMIKVRDCSEAPLVESDDDTTLDELNVHLLQELENSGFENG